MSNRDEDITKRTRYILVDEHQDRHATILPPSFPHVEEELFIELQLDRETVAVDIQPCGPGYMYSFGGKKKNVFVRFMEKLGVSL